MAELEIDINMRIREWDVIQVGVQLWDFSFCTSSLRALWNLYISQSPDVFSSSSKFQNVPHDVATFTLRHHPLITGDLSIKI